MAGDVKGEIAHEGGGGGAAGIGRGAEEGTDVHTFGEEQTLEFQVAAQNSGVRSSGQLQCAADQPTHTGGITDPDLIGLRGNFVAHGTIFTVGDAAAERKLSAAGFGDEVFEKQTAAIKDEFAVDVA